MKCRTHTRNSYIRGRTNTIYVYFICISYLTLLEAAMKKELDGSQTLCRIFIFFCRVKNCPLTNFVNMVNLQHIMGKIVLILDTRDTVFLPGQFFTWQNQEYEFYIMSLIQLDRILHVKKMHSQLDIPGDGGSEKKRDVLKWKTVQKLCFFDVLYY